MEQEVILEQEPLAEHLGEDDTPESTTEKYLLFHSGGLLFGITADHVVEIITNHTITKLPLLPGHVRGIINLRGQILPIVDIRLLLGQPCEQDTCIIILNIQEITVGILVDSVQRMLDIQQQSITPVPTRNAQKLVSGMCSLPDGQTMLRFDCNTLLDRD